MLMEMHVLHNFKKPETKSSDLIITGDTSVVKPEVGEKDMSRYSKKQIGFIAQELQSYYPELVREDRNGLLSIDYIGLIPVIVEAIKDQDCIITDLKVEIEKLKSILETPNTIKQRSKLNSFENEESTLSSSLNQNTPNPFNVTTEIRYYIPDKVKSALIYIFNMQGSLLTTTTISHRGHGYIIVNASELKAGMYIYSLVVDGREVDSKRMILTE